MPSSGAPILTVAKMNYRVMQKDSCMFGFPAFVLPPNLGQPMHSPSALTKLGRNFFAPFCTTSSVKNINWYDISAETCYSEDFGLLLAPADGGALLAGDRAAAGLRALQGQGAHRGGARQGQL